MLKDAMGWGYFILPHPVHQKTGIMLVYQLDQCTNLLPFANIALHGLRII